MIQAETHKDCDGQLWFSPSYVEEQIKSAYRTGIIAGTRINFHAISPMNGESVDNLENEFWDRIDVKYRELLKEVEQLRIAQTSLNRYHG